ncbi:polyprotein [Hirsutella rhossiliensis]
MTPGTSIDFNGAKITSKTPLSTTLYCFNKGSSSQDRTHRHQGIRSSPTKDHQQRGLTYIPIDLANAKLIVFTDGSFANNKDLSSQLGFVIALVNETETARTKDQFGIKGNVLHWSSTKCKRVTRSVLASEIYGMVNGFDIGISLATTIRKITDRLNLPPIPLIVCTDSFSLYECLVKLGTTKEKRLMIDIMALRQSYERREITEIRWINGADNPADAMTKASPNRALERLVDTNSLTIRIEGSVERPPR